MSMHIKMKDNEYQQVTTYYGKLDNKYPFIVEVSYGSSWDAKDNHYINSVEFVTSGNLYDDKPEKYWRKAEDKVKDFVMKWLFDKPKIEEDV